VTLRTTIATADGKRRYVRRLFATIADRYDFITRFLSYGQDRRWKERLIALAALRPDDRVLDLACGTGDLVFAAAPHVARAVGLDVTHRMLVLAQDRAFGTKPSLVTGDMMALPFAGAEFTIVTTGYGLRNVPGIEQAIAEIARVLAPGGRLLSLDFNRPDNPLLRAAYLSYLTVVGSILGFVLHRDPDTYRYIPESIRNYPGAHGVARVLERQGFSEVKVIPVLFGLMAIHLATKEQFPVFGQDEPRRLETVDRRPASAPTTAPARPAGSPGTLPR
jgi:demethylmenaquinone methyltransferase/2-methoxy-6-polyprenyl-1,4-benzoquinol methylase